MEIGNRRKRITFLFIVWLQKISIPPPQRVIGNSEEEGYEPKLEFPEGWGVETKTSFRGGSMDIFWNTTLFLKVLMNALC